MQIVTQKQNLKTPRNLLFMSRKTPLKITVKFQKKVPAKTRRGHLEGRRRRLGKDACGSTEQ